MIGGFDELLPGRRYRGLAGAGDVEVIAVQVHGGSSATVTYRDERDGGPRLNRNMVVFVAAAANRLSELRAMTRQHLAWRSIVGDHEALDLTAHQRKQAESKVAETSSGIDSLIGETFTLVLTPRQEPGTPDLTWSTTKAGTNGPLAERVERKLATEELLIKSYGGVRVKMDLDRYDLWSDRHDIVVRDLWATYARYPYLPRLMSEKVLYEAISNGTSNLNWEKETFAYADAHDGTTWVGIHRGEMVNPTSGGLLIHPDHVPTPADEGGGDDGGDGPDGAPGGGGASGGRKDRPTSGGDSSEPKGGHTQFYARFDLDAVRGIRQLGDILEHIANHLGSGVELSLELRATNPDGYDDTTRRVVNENAANLGARGAEFE